MQTPYAEANVPDWLDKLQNVIQSEEEYNETIPSDNTRGEWMIISDLHTSFESTSQDSSTYDWQQHRTEYTEQQSGEKPTLY